MGRGARRAGRSFLHLADLPCNTHQNADDENYDNDYRPEGVEILGH
jgi:hypothetical protein